MTLSQQLRFVCGQLGINLVVYALTSDYKKDATHVRALLREGRIEE